MANERSYFLNGPAYSYGEQDFATVFSQVYGGNGVSNTNGVMGDFKVEASQNMILQVGTGFSVGRGFMYENAEALLLTHDIAEPTQDRIDRIVIQFNTDPNVRLFKTYIKKGTPAASPVAPTVTRTTYVYELSVAQVRIRAGKSFIAQADITDERANKTVCGYIPLHNLLRGVVVDENGIVTMPNQSFVKTDGPVNIALSSDADHVLPISNVLFDKQKEISGGSFTAKSDGIYHLWLEVGFPENHLLVGTTIETYTLVNGVERFPFEARVVADSRDNYFIGSGVDLLNKGDVVTFRLRTRAAGTGKAVNIIKSTIAKIG